MFHKNIICLTAIFTILAGCTSATQFGEQPTVWNRQIDGGYSFGTFRYLVRKAPVLTQVVGNTSQLSPEETAIAIKEGISSANEMYGLKTVLDPNEDHSDAAKLIFLIKPRKSLLDSTICEASDPAVLQSSKKEASDVELMAVYCLRKTARSSLRASFGESSELTSERLTGMTRSLMTHLLPRNNPERGRNCSSRVTTDC